MKHEKSEVQIELQVKDHIQATDRLQTVVYNNGQVFKAS